MTRAEAIKHIFETCGAESLRLVEKACDRFPVGISMAKQRIIFLLSVLAVILGRPAFAAPNCSGAPDEFGCLEQNFDDLYRDNYADFWSILNKEVVEAKQCHGDEAFRFLGLVRIKSRNAEFNEFFAQSVEELCVASPRCFNGGVKMLPNTSKRILEAMLSNPMFHEKAALLKAGCLVSK